MTAIPTGNELADAVAVADAALARDSRADSVDVRIALAADTSGVYRVYRNGMVKRVRVLPL